MVVAQPRTTCSGDTGANTIPMSLSTLDGDDYAKIAERMRDSRVRVCRCVEGRHVPRIAAT